MDKHKLERWAVLMGLAAPLAAQAQVTTEPATAVLPQIEIRGQGLGSTTEGTGSYTTGKARTALPLNMALRDTPQSISVVTQQRIEDQNLVTVTDVVNNVTGVSVNQYETNRAGFTSRGFDIDNLQIDGIPTTWDQAMELRRSGWARLAIYDRVEVVRGATGLMTGAGNPSAAINLVRKHAISKELSGSAEVGVGSWQRTPRHGRRVDAAEPGRHACAPAWSASTPSRQQLDRPGSRTRARAIRCTPPSMPTSTPKTLLSVGYSRQEDRSEGADVGRPAVLVHRRFSKTNWDVSKTSSAELDQLEDSEYDNYFANARTRIRRRLEAARLRQPRSDRKADSYLLYVSGVPDRIDRPGHVPVRRLLPDAHRAERFRPARQRSVPRCSAASMRRRSVTSPLGADSSTSDSRAADFGHGSTPDIGNFNNWNGAAYPNPSWGAADLL